MPEEIDLQIKEILDRAQNILLTAHVRPDGDAVSAMLALATALRTKGKQVQALLKDGVSTILHHLPGGESITKIASGETDCLVVLACSDKGRIAGLIDDCEPDLNIDHHITNIRF